MFCFVYCHIQVETFIYKACLLGNVGATVRRRGVISKAGSPASTILEGNFMASTLYLKMWQVFGGPGLRQKMSFQPSQTFCTRDRDVIDHSNDACHIIFNSDKTGTNAFALYGVVATTPEKCEEEAIAQLTDGAFENMVTHEREFGSLMTFGNKSQSCAHMSAILIMESIAESFKKSTVRGVENV